MGRPRTNRLQKQISPVTHGRQLPPIREPSLNQRVTDHPNASLITQRVTRVLSGMSTIRYFPLTTLTDRKCCRILHPMKILLVLGITFCSLQVQGQTRWLSGTITDATTHEPLRNASITSKPDNKGVRTDSLGRFRLPVSQGNPTIVISMIGYAPKTITSAAFPGSSSPPIQQTYHSPPTQNPSTQSPSPINAGNTVTKTTRRSNSSERSSPKKRTTGPNPSTTCPTKNTTK
ncbi:carboxypeptidase-like regulatory domain-containing protein [Puia sp. P3]|uniref:carboxypeptidase-like regulatory domain-containing protein n=1 Tax=Puia sp. P3 TaxID=3423952 RepID=UPI003D676EBD